MTNTTPQLYVASASPRRHALLRQLGLRFEVVDGAVEEFVAPGESPEAYVQRMALAKAGLRLAQHVTPVLGADTEVVVDIEVLGKPRDAAHARAMMLKLSGRTHRVLSAVAVVNATQQRV
ncbi:MAG: Maf family protein, partial [Pseudomonadota bacterium]